MSSTVRLLFQCHIKQCLGGLILLWCNLIALLMCRCRDMQIYGSCAHKQQSSCHTGSQPVQMLSYCSIVNTQQTISVQHQKRGCLQLTPNVIQIPEVDCLNWHWTNICVDYDIDSISRSVSMHILQTLVVALVLSWLSYTHSQSRLCISINFLRIEPMLCWENFISIYHVNIWNCLPSDIIDCLL